MTKMDAELSEFKRKKSFDAAAHAPEATHDEPNLRGDSVASTHRSGVRVQEVSRDRQEVSRDRRDSVTDADSDSRDHGTHRTSQSSEEGEKAKVVCNFVYLL
jgi:hypothetical protein